MLISVNHTFMDVPRGTLFFFAEKHRITGKIKRHKNKNQMANFLKKTKVDCKIFSFFLKKIRY